uniref:Protein-tyrosine-phosphatase n=1 Tax=Parastrongyloides trichosuri TaxID=131310 RepID=A0A0N4ZA70_PARTI
MGNQNTTPQKEESWNGRSVKIKKSDKNTNTWAKKLIKKSYEDLISEYKCLKSYNSPDMALNNHKGQSTGNRYRDIPLLESTRVVLNNKNEDDNYIHANWINVDDVKRFICTQGPMTTTVNAFWEMIFQEKVFSILMLCGLCEEGYVKCSEYWPLEVNGVKNFDNFKIENLSVSLSAKPKMTTTVLRVTKNGESHTLKHYQYLEWPDVGTPRNDLLFPFKLLDMATDVPPNISSNHPPPVVVHCSAGIGRTGTLVGLYLARHHLLTKTTELKMPDLVKILRNQRAFSIQNGQQYIYMHACLLKYLLEEGWVEGNTSYTKWLEVVEKQMEVEQTRKECY